jgi:hypothetical protein
MTNQDEKLEEKVQQKAPVSIEEFENYFTSAENAGKILRDLNSNDPNAQSNATQTLRTNAAEMAKIAKNTPAEIVFRAFMDPRAKPTQEDFLNVGRAYGALTQGQALGYFKDYRTELIEKTPTKGLEALVFNIPFSKMNGDDDTARMHNDAVKIHEKYIGIRNLNAGYEGRLGEQNKVTPHDYVGEIVRKVNDIAMEVASSLKYVDEKTAQLWASAIASMAASEGVARVVGELMETSAQKEFNAYFDKDKKFTKEQYARRNLAEIKDDLKAMNYTYLTYQEGKKENKPKNGE